MRHPEFDVQTLIDRLQGTCQSLDQGLEESFPGMEFIDLIDQDHGALDNQIFLCEECGWWCESHEQDEEGNCQDCSTMEENED